MIKRMKGLFCHLKPYLGSNSCWSSYHLVKKDGLKEKTDEIYLKDEKKI